MATVLVLDALQRKSLALTRFLGMDGHRVLTADTTFFTISRFSRYAASSFVYPNPAREAEAFISWLLRLIKQESIDAVLPSDDYTTDALTRYADRLRGRTGLLIPPRASFEAMRDKAQSAGWFQRAGVPHPATVVIRSLSEVRAAAESLGLPLVIKPRVTSGSRGMRYVHRLEEVETVYAQVHRDHPWPILQRFVTPGPKYHVCLLYDSKHRLVARYVQKELRQYPITGGPSTMQESVDRPDLTALLEPLFSALPWAGALHADVMEDGRTGQPYVLEVNPRYWQSLNVAHRAGINFARLNLALALGEAPPPAPPARSGVRGRALVPFDCLAYLSDPRRSQWNPGFFSAYGRDTWDDLLSWEDPGPTVGFALAVVRYLFNRSMWNAVLRRSETQSARHT